MLLQLLSDSKVVDDKRALIGRGGPNLELKFIAALKTRKEFRVVELRKRELPVASIYSFTFDHTKQLEPPSSLNY